MYHERARPPCLRAAFPLERVQWRAANFRRRHHSLSLHRGIYLRPQEGARILDIGCGTAKILNHLPRVEYIGFDPNPAYIEWARNTFGNRGTFHAGRFTAESIGLVGQVDVALVLAVLHHLS